MNTDWIEPLKARRDRFNEWLPSFIQFGIIMFHVRTEHGQRIFSPLARFRRFWHVWNTIGAILTLIFIPVMVAFLLSFAAAVVKERPGPTPILKPENALIVPGVNDMIPLQILPEFLVVIFLSMAVHEGGHAIAAIMYEIDIEEMGMLFLGPIPAGAYVLPDMDQVIDRRYGQFIRIMAAGNMNNVALVLLLIPVALALPTTVIEWGEAYGTALISGGQDVTGIVQLSAAANIVYGLIALNINLVLFNSTPIVGLDGGWVAGATVDLLISKLPFQTEFDFRESKVTTTGVIVAFLSLLMVASLLIPYIVVWLL